jgi:hypothetical protein
MILYSRLAFGHPEGFQTWTTQIGRLSRCDVDLKRNATLKVPAYRFDENGRNPERKDIDITLSKEDLRFASETNEDPKKDVPVWPKLVEKVDATLREATDWKSVLLDKDGQLFDCKPKDDRLSGVRQGLCETSSVVASVLGIPLKTDRRIMENTPTKGIVDSFKHFGKGPTFVYTPFGVEMILRGNPETGEDEFFPSVNIDSSRFGFTKDLGVAWIPTVGPATRASNPSTRSTQFTPACRRMCTSCIPRWNKHAQSIFPEGRNKVVYPFPLRLLIALSNTL